MRVSGSGNKRNDERRVTLSFTGTDREFVHLIDALERAYLDAEPDSLHESAIEEIMLQINYRAGSPINHDAPKGEIK